MTKQNAIKFLFLGSSSILKKVFNFFYVIIFNVSELQHLCL